MRVPVYSAPTVTENAVPVVQQNPNVSSAAFGAPIAQGLTNVANAFMQVRDDADNVKAVESDTIAADRLLKLTFDPNEGFVNVKGRNVLIPGADGKPVSQSYLERAKQVGADLERDLTPTQIAKFRRRFDQRLLGFQKSLVRHESREIASHMKSASEANVKKNAEMAIANYGDQAMVAMSIQNIAESLRAQAAREGLPADAQEMLVAENISKVHFGVIASALENRNVAYANKHLKENSGEMQAEHVLKIHGLIAKEMDAVESVGVSERVFGKMRSQIEPNDFDRLETLVATQESGNRERDDKGNLITSPRGAQGKMQVMPYTAKNPGYGVTPAKDDSDAERSRVGRDYLKAMMKEYGGDVTKALAAYNAGPGAVDKALKNAEKMARNAELDPNLPAKSWLELLPKETQDYVSKIGSQYASGIGGKRATLEDVQNQVRAEMIGKPVHQIKMAVDHVTQLFETNQKAKKQREDENLGEAMKYIDLYNGDMTMIPASIRMGLRGDQLDNLQAYAAKRAKGIEPATDWSVYYDLKRDPAVLKETNLIAFRHVLAESEFKSLVNEQQDLRTGKAEHITATRTASQILNSFLTQANIDPTPKPSSSPTSDAAKVGRAMRAQTTLIEAAERAKGRKLTPDEITQETAKLFTNVQVRDSWFGVKVGANTKPAFDVLSNDEVVVPKGDRDLIVAALTAKRLPVTEAAIREKYLKKHNLPGR